MQVIHTVAELDAKIAECDRAEAVSDDAMRAVFGTFHMAPPADLPADPFAPEYRARQQRLYAEVAGRPYDLANEATPLDVEAALRRPFPFSTGSCTTAGEHFIAAGFLLRAMALPPGSRVLEFGPGWGNSTMLLAKLGHHVTAVDVEPRFCALLRRRAEQEGVAIEVVRDDFFWAERAGRQFDAVVFFECFHHCDDHLRLLRALHAVTAPGGRVFFGAEPVLPDLPVPWGLRLDGNSLWAVRKNGWLELGFRDDYFRAALARTGWFGQRTACRDPDWITVWEARRRKDYALRLDAADPRLLSRAGLREGGRLVFRDAPAGTALWGPYTGLPAGRYRASFHFSPGTPVYGSGSLDVCVEGGTRVLASAPFDGRLLPADHPVASLLFAAEDDVERLEARLFCAEGFSAELARLEILPVA